MKYRIKITTYVDGHITYTAYKKVWLFWRRLDWYGEIGTKHFNNKYYLFDNREEALKAIDNNFNKIQYGTVKSIDFEYINK
jgi:hypothetical protein